MKRFIAAIGATTTLLTCMLGAGTAAADPLPMSAASTAVAVDLSESADAWLHEHCSYRGLHPVSGAAMQQPGTIGELLRRYSAFWGIPQPTAKIFRCAERPPFWSGEFTPASPAAVDCTEPANTAVCAPPIAAPAPAVVTTVSWAPPSQPPAQPSTPPARVRVDLRAAIDAVIVPAGASAARRTVVITPATVPVLAPKTKARPAKAKTTR
jgi:hypothetical protein